MTPEFDDIVDLDGLGADEVARLRGVHDLLVAAGRPPELPTHLGRPPAVIGVANPVHADLETPDPDRVHRSIPEDATVVPLPIRRRPAAALLIAATVAAACFGGGYVIAQGAKPSALRAVQVVSLQGDQHNTFASASISLGSADVDGNVPIQLSVKGLPQPHRAEYYLMLWQNGKPKALCGTFRVGADGVASVSFNVPYAITKSSRWVVTEMAPGMTYPGHVVMKTS